MIESIWQPRFQQTIFRQLVDAFSRPGHIIGLPGCNNNAMLAVLATLTDGGSSMADPHKCLEKADWLRLQLEEHSPDLAAFIACHGCKPPDFEPNTGTLASPEHGATLVISVDALSDGEKQYQLTGPGIEAIQEIAPKGLNISWFQQRETWNGAFPLGVDMVLTAAGSVLALPRTTHIKEI